MYGNSQVINVIKNIENIFQFQVTLLFNHTFVKQFVMYFHERGQIDNLHESSASHQNFLTLVFPYLAGYEIENWI